MEVAERKAAEAEAKESEIRREISRFENLERELKSCRSELAIERDRLLNYRALVTEKWRAEERKILALVEKKRNTEGSSNEEMSALQVARASCERLLSDMDKMFEKKSPLAPELSVRIAASAVATPVRSPRSVTNPRLVSRPITPVSFSSSRNRTPTRECYLDVTRPQRSVSRGRRAEEIFSDALVKRFGSLSAAFNSIDINKSGHITLVELEWAAEQAKAKRAQADAFFFSKKQSVSGRLTFDEFCS